MAGCVSHINLGMILKMPTILVRLGCYNKNIISWVAYSNTHRFLMVLEAESPGSGCQHGQILVKVRFLVANCQPLTPSLHGGRGREPSQAAFIRAPISFTMALYSTTNRLPKAPPPNITTLGTRFQHMNVGGTRISNLQHQLQSALARGGAPY